ncbi:syntaxin 5 [Trypanosoma equiperdum]|uniref:Syntaxin 5 n=4 Tax=Trypanozoon TaxID=39700 RepID=Q388I2_TRYB2|nr:syntaxin 5, putative [Trypanosoma brucei gambiense DAL972]XP_827900.1 syntaxin 5 [Trypanosoma brucei brucei TREU927]RHW69310.1 syntaxin 5 [Trypanosoma brucei equiperdum]SCU66520.1 syntaxin 5 [Trypanosoma equiperdum]EAN78788.1 syntaxin 5 [Trypanosoma brucei brucei TREU927]CBH16556.1 syntaxin 5, putative [Trypanosoma brucei gambiense DAL972]|eukprot:XP_011778820.1 syntaxin 5, putative [Trypanosoma brucei gambiense DAL972]
MVVERDRSNELHSIFNGMKHGEVLLHNGVRHIDPSRGELLQSNSGLRSSNETQIFNRFAQAFAADLAKVSESIMRLTQLTQRQTVFEDRSSEVTALTQVVKTSLQRLHADLNTLDELKARALDAEKVVLARTRASSGSEAHSLWGGRADVDSLVQSQTKHSDTIVETLRTRLARTGQTFRSTLQQQTKEMKSNAQRRHMFTTGDRPQTFESALFHDQEMQQQQQMQLASRGENVQYYKQRSEAVREIEAAVVEVGEMFNDFTRLVHEQNEIVLRIDTNVETSLRHVNAGSNELLRYLANLTSNRGLIIKIFAVLFFFLLFFGFLVVR